MPRGRAVKPRRPNVLVSEHPEVSDPRMYLTCACCIRRELMPAIEALRRGQHGKAKILLMQLWLELDRQIEAAVAASARPVQ
jgi:hypothetical protein